jgi:lysophospholipase L1-like esterase
MRMLMILLVISLTSEYALGQYDSLYLKNKTYHLQRGLHAISRTTKADVVMLGNSITFGANWSELLGRQNIVNRGIGGDNTYGFLSRLDDIVALQPKMCFVMGGINDIFSDIPLDSIYANYVKIIERLRAKGITPVIQSTLHVSQKWKRAGEKNPLVSQLNVRLSAYARQNEIEFMDVDGALSEAEVLKDEYTHDGVHLTAAAYEKWVGLIEGILVKNGL